MPATAPSTAPLDVLDLQRRVAEVLPKLSRSLGNASIDEVAVAANGAVVIRLRVSPVASLFDRDPNELSPFEI